MHRGRRRELRREGATRRAMRGFRGGPSEIVERLRRERRRLQFESAAQQQGERTLGSEHRGRGSRSRKTEKQKCNAADARRCNPLRCTATIDSGAQRLGTSQTRCTTVPARAATECDHAMPCDASPTLCDAWGGRLGSTNFDCARSSSRLPSSAHASRFTVPTVWSHPDKH